jgi:glycosyltransferase involved in cell wall biosynthesis
MRILYFTRDYTTHDYRFVSTLAGNGYDVYYLRLERGSHQLEDRPMPPQVKIVTWKGGLKPARLIDAPGLLMSLRRVLQDVKPDIIHAGPVQTCGLLAALSGFHPLVTMSWGSDLLRDADRDGSMRALTRFVLQRSTVLVGDCDAVRQKAQEFGFPAAKVVTFPWGIDLKRFNPDEQEGIRLRKGWQENFVLLHLRSWESIYGVDVLVKGFVMAAQQYPKLRLIMLGGGSLAGQVRHVLTRGGMLDKVHFGGQVPQHELPRFYRSADLYLSASHSDGSSVSLMEALASGLPVLVSDIPGNREWVTFGVQGWLFPDGDVQALAQGILRAVEQRERLPKMGRAARQLAEERADWRKNFTNLLKAYEMAIS